jgi:hypothetical protein
MVVSPGPSTKTIPKLAAADAGSNIQRMAELSINKPITPAITLAIINFPFI